ncbi:MAG: hypothetical protein JWQ38_3415 [Flavipsychrobacter sp.]|nr:hypothetical protein [Flavipsychrobacter sp.]
MKFLSHLPHGVQDVLYTVLGIFFAGFGLKSFLIPNVFLDGGVTGVCLLIHELWHINLAILIVVVNIPFIIMGAYQVNRKFAYKTLACVIGLALCLQFVTYPVITQDKLLVSLFGGFFLGIGIGLCMRSGCAIDGIEVLVVYTLKRSSLTVSEIILGINTAIFLISAVKFGLPIALYAMLTYYAATKTIAYVVDGIEEFTGVTIISGQSEEIKEKLVMQLGRGITIYKGERGFMKHSYDVSQDCDIVFTVITRLEVRKLKNVVYNIDPKAFIFTNTIKEAAGGILKRTSNH